MKLTFDQRRAGCADGAYTVTGGIGDACLLYWADGNGALSDWACFGCFPLSPDGDGAYRMEGERGIPEQATHVLARGINADGVQEEILVSLPMREETPVGEASLRFLIMTDLHLSRKPWKIRQALEMGKGYDGILISGDLVNDGRPEQLAQFWQCVLDKTGDTPVFAVTGNHDYPHYPFPLVPVPKGIHNYPSLQEHLLNRGEQLGCTCEQDPCGAYYVSWGSAEVIGLNAVTHFRQFKFPDGAQLDWLEKHLQGSTAARHIILCHAPLFAHRAYKRPGDQPYLNRDRQLQQIVDRHRGVVFVAGHTHLSMNGGESCVERDDRGNIYLNAGSIRPTTMKEDDPFQPEDWKNGNVVELTIGEQHTVITAVSVGETKRFPRGYYRF